MWWQVAGHRNSRSLTFTAGWKMLGLLSLAEDHWSLGLRNWLLCVSVSGNCILAQSFCTWSCRRPQRSGLHSSWPQMRVGYPFLQIPKAKRDCDLCWLHISEPHNHTCEEFLLSLLSNPLSHGFFSLVSLKKQNKNFYFSILVSFLIKIMFVHYTYIGEPLENMKRQAE